MVSVGPTVISSSTASHQVTNQSQADWNAGGHGSFTQNFSHFHLFPWTTSTVLWKPPFSLPWKTTDPTSRAQGHRPAVPSAIEVGPWDGRRVDEFENGDSVVKQTNQKKKTEMPMILSLNYSFTRTIWNRWLVFRLWLLRKVFRYCRFVFFFKLNDGTHSMFAYVPFSLFTQIWLKHCPMGKKWGFLKFLLYLLEGSPSPQKWG